MAPRGSVEWIVRCIPYPGAHPIDVHTVRSRTIAQQHARHFVAENMMRELPDNRQPLAFVDLDNGDDIQRGVISYSTDGLTVTMHEMNGGEI